MGSGIALIARRTTCSALLCSDIVARQRGGGKPVGCSLRPYPCDGLVASNPIESTRLPCCSLPGGSWLMAHTVRSRGEYGTWNMASSVSSVSNRLDSLVVVPPLHAELPMPLRRLGTLAGWATHWLGAWLANGRGGGGATGRGVGLRQVYRRQPPRAVLRHRPWRHLPGRLLRQG